MRIPEHVGIIPDGNRRWAQERGLPKQDGYEKGLDPGLQLYRLCAELGIKEITYYGFTQDNTKRPAIQREAFTRACIDAVELLSKENAELLVIGNTDSPMFPPELVPYTKKRCNFGRGGIKVNFLVNYGWQWIWGIFFVTTLGKGQYYRFNPFCRRVQGGSDHPVGRTQALKWFSARPVDLCRFLRNR